MGACKTPIEQSAATLLLSAASPRLYAIGGVYLKDRDVAAPDDEENEMGEDIITVDAASAMLDPDGHPSDEGVR